MNKPTYWKRLQNHPGVPVAFMVSVLGIVAGLLGPDGNWWDGFAALVFWIPVLITARTQPVEAMRESE